MKPFSIFKRNAFYYVQFVDPVSKKRMTARSTGQQSRETAEQQAIEWLYSGKIYPQKETASNRLQNLIIHKELELQDVIKILNAIHLYYGNELPTTPLLQNTNTPVPLQSKSTHQLTEYMRHFWDYETSEYVNEKLNHGQKIGRRHCYDMQKIVKYWEEFFDKDYTLEELTTLKLKEFETYLTNRVRTTINKRTKIQTDHTLSYITRGNIIKCGHICFKWAISRKLISENPCDGLTTYTATGKKRDILTAEETQELFKNGTWSDERARIASMVAFTCGMRMGEILALKVENIAEDRLYINHSWSSLDKLKSTKNGKDRIVPLPGFVRSSLLQLAMKNPHKGAENSFIFWGDLPDRPVVPAVLRKGFRDALISIGISNEEKAKRNIVFHSWRHSYATFISSCVDEHHAQTMLGHLTASMTQHYADHKLEQELLDVAKASNVLFDKLFA